MTSTGSADDSLPRNHSRDAAEAEPDAIDPRKLRSRARLLDAATALLKSGGVEAVTIEAVTRASKVAKTTLYRHFDNAMDLRAATFERLIPQVIAPPATGSLRDRLIELLDRQAAIINEAPLHLTTLAWLALGTDRPDTDAGPAVTSLRQRLIEIYRQPFDELLDSREVRAQLGQFDLSLAQAQLVGPIVFARLTGLRHTTPADFARIVDDFLAARAATR
ncbi:TetR/AcrR family transcriptional regulator [Nocardia sp. GCM10030253]|uniref:TetR/AcrR family transcriptional regulator n=1 Tax=Nocardia sp. GCM10030253 TaxID=3273404 RepID=UPI003629687D